MNPNVYSIYDVLMSLESILPCIFWQYSSHEKTFRILKNVAKCPLPEEFSLEYILIYTEADSQEKLYDFFEGNFEEKQKFSLHFPLFIEDKLYWFRCKANRLQENSTTIVGIFEDITSEKEVEIELRKQNREYEIVLNSLKDIVFLVDEHFIFHNAWFSDEKVLFKPRNEFIGKTFAETLGNDFAALFEKPVYDAIHYDKTSFISYPSPVSNIQKHWYSAKITPTINFFVGRKMALIIVSDITENVDKEHQITFLNRLLNYSGDIIQVSDEVGNFVYVSENAAKSIGLSTEEMLSKNIKDIEKIFQGDDSLWQKHVQELKEAGKHGVLLEGIHIHHGGQERPVEVKVTYVELEHKGFVVALVRDITERKRVQKTIQESNTLLAMLHKIQSGFFVSSNITATFNHLLSGLCEITHSEYGFIGEVLYNKEGNPYLKTLAITNIAWDEITRKFYDENVEKGLEFHNLKTLFGQVMTTQKPVISNNPYTDERRGGLPPNHPRMNSFLGLPIMLGDKLIGMAGIANRPTGYDEDLVQFLQPLLVTCGTLVHAYRIENERSRTEKELIFAKDSAEKALQAKSDFLSMISHEIRTPMNAVLGITDLLLKENLTPQQVEMLNILKFSGENLLVLINDVLDFSKIEAGRIDFDEVDFNFLEFLNNLKHIFSIKAKEKGIHFKINFDTDIPTFLIGDTVRLSQVLTNLLSNAVKFTEVGKVILSIEVAEETDDDIELLFTIKDTGIGIPSAKIDIIFERFTQANSQTTRKYGGTGLGLAITKRLLELQNSKIEVKSEEGVGSTFFFKLKFRKYDASKNVESQEEQQNTESYSELKGVRILVAEDNLVNQFVARKFLTQWGVELDFANNGKIVLQKMSDNHYDLILMDLEMPEMDGYEATTIIKKQEKFKHIPIIALTASVMPEIKEKALRIGMVDHVAKPFNSQELYQKIVHHLKPHKRETMQKDEFVPDFQLQLLRDIWGGEEGLDDFKAAIKEETTRFKLDFVNACQYQDEDALQALAHKIMPTIKMLHYNGLESCIMRLRKLVRSEANQETLQPYIENFIRLCEALVESLN